MNKQLLLMILISIILFNEAYSLISWLAASCMSGKGPTTAPSPSLSFSIKPKDQKHTCIFLLLFFNFFNGSITPSIFFAVILWIYISPLSYFPICSLYTTDLVRILPSFRNMQQPFSTGLPLHQEEGSFFVISKQCKSMHSKFHYKPFFFSIHDSCHSTSESFPVQMKVDNKYILMSHSDYCTSDINNY